MADVAELGRLVKQKYPGAYDDMADDELGRTVKAKYPGSYDDFSDTADTMAAIGTAAGATLGATPEGRALKIAGRGLSFAARPVVATTNFLSDRFDRAAGGVIDALSGGAQLPGMVGVANKYGQGLLFGNQPTAKEAFAKAGFTESPIPEEYAAMAGKTGQVARFLTSPEAVSAAAGYAASLPVDVGAGAIANAAKPVLSAATNPLRQLPVVKQVGRAFSRGFDIADPAERQAFREIVDTRLGEQALKDALLDERLAGYHDLAPEAKKAIRDYVNRPWERTLPDELKPVAEDLQRLYPELIQARTSVGLSAEDLGSHLGKLEDKAAAAIEEARQQRLFLKRLKQSRVEAATGGSGDLYGMAGTVPDERIAPFGLTPINIEELPQPTMPALQRGIRVRAGEAATGPKGGTTSLPPLRRYEGIKPGPRHPGPPPTPEDALMSQGPPRGVPVKMQVETPTPGVLPEQPDVVLPPDRSISRAKNVLKSDEKRARKLLEKYEERAKVGEADKFPRKIGSRGIDIYQSEDDLARLAAERTGYDPRIYTKEYQAATEQPGYRYGQPTGIGTGPVKRRVTNPRLSTSELEARLSQKTVETTGKPVFRDIIEASELKGKADYAKIAHANIYNDVADLWRGKKTGTIELKSLRGMGTGYSKDALERVGAVKVDDATASALKDLDEVLSPQNYGKGKEMWRRFSQGWKTAVTRVNPQFGSRNAQWNAAVGFAWGNRDPRNWAEAANVVSKAQGYDRPLWEEMVRNRIIGGGFMKQEIESGARSGLEKAAATVLDKPNAAIEDVSRAAFYIAMKKAGKSEREAARMVKQVYFNYARDAYTALEGNLRRNWVPFYSWSRNIVPLFLRSTFEKPSVVGAGGLVQRNFGNAQPGDMALMPDVAENLGIVQKPKPGQKPNERVITSVGGLQGFQQGNILGERGRGWFAPVDAAASSVYPFVGVPAQLAMQRNAFFGSPFRGGPNKKLSGVGELIARIPAVQKQFGIIEKSGELYGPEGYDLALRATGPAPQFIDDAIAAANGDKGAEQRVVRWLTGISTQTRDLTGAKRAMQYKAREEATAGRQGQRTAQKASRSDEQRQERDERLLGR